MQIAKINKTQALTIIVIALVTLYAALFFAKKTNLITADLGRHIKNGEVLIETGNQKVFSKNLYSFTQPGHPTINHHWGFGVATYLIHKAFSFTGLSIFYVMISAATVLIMLIASKKLANISYVAFFTVLTLPLLATRVEIRPEGISYLLLAIYFYILTQHSLKKSFRLIFFLPILQLLWVNVHIFFIFGIFLIGVYLLQAIVEKNKTKMLQLTIVLIISTLVGLANPLGLNGALVPLTIFKEYGYMLVENQTVFFMQKRAPKIDYFHFEVLVFLALQVLILSADKKFIKKNLALTIITFIFVILGFRAIRLIPLFGLFFIPYASTMADKIVRTRLVNKQRVIKKSLIAATITMVVFGLLVHNQHFSPISRASGLGLGENIQKSAEFFNENNISGPIYNNYDIGGYLIYNLYPKNKVFVDNRPEAYSVAFFQKTYIPIQQGQENWEKFDEKYDFNAIFFFRRDQTYWAQPFLIQRIRDPNWIPVFTDEQTIILVKDDPKNKDVIEKYRLPNELFTITPG